jgi:branched-chain amino acid transport system permease protein
MAYVEHLAISLSIYLILAVSLNLLAGYTGLLSVAHAGLFGIGAYSASLVLLHLSQNFFVAVGAGIFVTMFLAVLIAFPTLHLEGNYFILATTAFQIIIVDVLTNWMGLTRGPLGLAGMARPELFGISFASNRGFLLLCLAAVAAAYLVASRVVSSQYGLVLRGIRDDQLATEMLGKNVAAFKLGVFALSGALAALAGALYASYLQYISPDAFVPALSFLLLTIVIVGGSGSLGGSALGTLLVVLLPEALRFAGLPSTIAAQLQQIIYGLALVLLMLFRPQGMKGEYGLK